MNPRAEKEHALQAVSRSLFTILIALILAMGTFTLVGCTNDPQPSQASQDADDDQDNCYGDDLPAVKQK